MWPEIYLPLLTMSPLALMGFLIKLMMNRRLYEQVIKEL